MIRQERARDIHTRIEKSCLLVLIVAIGSLAGCVDASPDFRVPVPRVGHHVEYVGSDGSLLSVRVLGEDVRFDPYQRDRHVAVVEYVIRPAKNPDVEVRFEESVDLGTGLHLRQDVDCLFPTELPEDPADACKQRFIQVFMGGHGLPGALGMGPLWGREIPTNGVLYIEIAPAAMKNATVAYSVIPAGDCLRLTRVREDESLVFRSWMPGTVLDGPFVICPDDVFPTQFRSHMKMPPAFSSEPYPVFTKTTRSTSGDSPALQRATSLWQAAPAMERTHAGPLYLLSDDLRFTNFSGATAHREAMRLDATYKDQFDQGAAVVFASHGNGGGTRTLDGVIRYETAQWHLVLRGGRGAGHETRIEQEQTYWPDGRKTTSYALVDSRAPSWDGEKPQFAEDATFVDPIRAYEQGDHLFHEALIGAAHASVTTDNGIYAFPSTTADDRFWVTVAYRPPDAPQDAMVITPWLLTTDALTGAVVRVQAAPEHRGSI